MITFSQIPDLQRIKDSFKASVELNRVAQTQLLTCADGGAGLAFALAFAQYIACDNKSEDACGICISCKQLQHGNYPELHVFFPFVKTTAEKGKVDSANDLLREFYLAFKENPFLTKTRWQQLLETGNKQFLIPVTEAERIIKSVQTKAADQKPRFFIIWLPEFLNAQASNKLLKTLEEPGNNTFFFLVTTAAERLLPTVKSRCITLKIPGIRDEAIRHYLENKGYSFETATNATVSAQGSLGQALDNASTSVLSERFGRFFASWMRLLYMKKMDELVVWIDDITSLNREDLKSFLTFSSSLIKQAFDYAESGKSIVFYSSGFSLERFSQYINANLINEIEASIGDAYRDIERNANPRIVMLSLSIILFKYVGQA